MTIVIFDQCGCSPVGAIHAKCPLTAAPKTDETDMTDLERLKAAYYDARAAYYDARAAYYGAHDAARAAYCDASDAAYYNLRDAAAAYYAALAAQEKEPTDD